jgi:hypothetical protein
MDFHKTQWTSIKCHEQSLEVDENQSTPITKITKPNHSITNLENTKMIKHKQQQINEIHKNTMNINGNQ